jgi:hypothetical protein
LRKHLCARVGSVPLQKLRAADLQAIYAAMTKDGLADRTRLHLHRVVSSMLTTALQWGVVGRNVATMVDAPRVNPGSWCERCNYRSICPAGREVRYEPVEEDPDPWLYEDGSIHLLRVEQQSNRSAASS